MPRSGFCSLLYNMGQFVCQKPVAGYRSGTILTGTEHHITADGIGECMHRLCRLSRARICMHTNLAEIMPEVRFKERARRSVERLARRAKHIMDDRWHGMLGLLVVS